MTITTSMPPGLAAAQADHVADCEDCGDLPVQMFMALERDHDDDDASVGFRGGWFVTARMIGAQIGDLVLSKADAAAALGPMVAWMEREVSERLTASDDSDAPMMPYRMEAAR